MDLAKEAIETLRNAAFPVYAVPPSQWRGDVMIGGFSGNQNRPQAIKMRYDDNVSVEWPQRRVEIVSTGAEGLGNRTPSDSYLLWEHSYHSEITNFVYNITTERFPERPIPGSERFNAEMVDGKVVPKTVELESAGPRRLIDVIPFKNGYQMERIAFEEHPALRMYRVQTPEVEVLTLAWGWEDDALEEFVSSGRSLWGDQDLLAEIERAEYAAWEKIRQRER